MAWVKKLDLKICYFLLLLCGFSKVLFGLTNGPVQPEFSTFEPVDVTDLVNLPTGDFTYVLPIGDVKGPAGTGYPIVLSYHAGIMQEQEASWVGLGWSLNVGAINRMVRGSPDDYSGDEILQYAYNKGDHGWSCDIGGGWGPISATVGFSYSANNRYSFDGLTSVGMSAGAEGSPVSMGMNFNLRSVTISLGIGYDVNKNVNVGAGVTLGGDNGPNFGASIGFSDSETKEITKGDKTTKVTHQNPIAGFSLSSTGVSASVAGGAGGAMGMSLSDKGLFQTASGVGATIPLPNGIRIDFSLNWWRWHYSTLTYGAMYGYNFHGADVSTTDLLTYNTLLERLVGGSTSQYIETQTVPLRTGLGKRGSSSITLPGSGRGAPKETYTTKAFDKLEYIRGKMFDTDLGMPAQDIYQVSGQGTGGAFQPFANHSVRTCVLPDDPINDGLIGTPQGGEGTLDKPYLYEKDGQSYYFNKNVTKFSPEIVDGITFKMLGEYGLNLSDYVDDQVSYTGSNDMQNISQQNAGTRIDPLFGFNPELPNRLSGFVVTDQEGKSYYYTLPLFTYNNSSYVNNTKDSPKSSDGIFSTGNTHSYSIETTPYAVTWLLTAITGPDYIKTVMEPYVDPTKTEKSPEWSLEERLLPHDGDYGYWVAFSYEYGNRVEEQEDGSIKSIDQEGDPIKKTAYRFRIPFYDKNSSEKYHKILECPEKGKPVTYASTFGIKEVTYLKAIETASEIALFKNSERLDGYGVAADDPTWPKFAPSRLSTSNVLLVNKWNKSSHYDKEYNRLFLVPGDEVDDVQYTNSIEFESSDLTTPEKFSIIKIPVDRYTNLDINFKDDKVIKPGTSLLRLQFKGDISYHSIWPFVKRKLVRKDKRASIIIVKDREGCTYKADGTPEYVSPRMNPKRYYYDETFLNPPALRNAFMPSWSMPFTSRAKCFWVRKVGNEYWLYVVHYCEEIPGGALILFGPKDSKYDYTKTAAKFNTSDEDWWWAHDDTPIKNLALESVWLTSEADRYENWNENSKYVKKLDKIEWYSKSKYPYITRFSDLTDADMVDQGIKPYHSVIFNYDYSLAKGTPNSKAPGKGRLTLKSVQVIGGNESNKMYMPPYLFEYQNANVQYAGFEKIDAWGYQKTDLTKSQNDPMQGVNWNLSKVTFPSGGLMEMDYERDFAQGPIGTLYQMKIDNPCVDVEQLDYPEPTPGAYFLEKDFSEYSYKPTGGTEFTLTDLNDINVGSYFFVKRTTSYKYYGYRDCECSQDNIAGYYKVTSLDRNLKKVFTTSNVNRSIMTETSCGRCESSENDQSDTRIRLYFFKEKSIYCDGIKIKSLTTKGLGNSTTTRYSYLNGTLTMLPEAMLPNYFTKGYEFEDISGTPYSTSYVNKYRYIEDQPYSTDVGVNYNNGNISVLYSQVDVRQTSDKSDANVNGVKRTFFWNRNDLISVNGRTVPVVESVQLPNANGVKVVKINDRSSLIGMTKKVEFWNNDLTKIVYEKENQIAFGDELSNHVVCQDNFNTKLGNNKMLGVIRHRGISVDKNGANKSVVDINIFTPYLVGVKEKQDEVTVETKYGYFDAQTGNSLATLTVHPQSSGSNTNTKKLNFKVPYSYIFNSNSTDPIYDQILRKNYYSIEAGNLTFDVSDLEDDLQKLDYTTLMAANKRIKKASAQQLSKEDFNIVYKSNQILEQARLFITKTFSWKGNELFNWPQNGDGNWKKTTEITKIDRFTRPRSETITNAQNSITYLKNTAIYHPRLNVASAVVQNAKYNECAVLTGDFKAGDELHKDYIDYDNGWEIGGCEITSTEKKYGNNSIKVYNSTGPQINIVPISDQEYLLTFWAKIKNGTLEVEVSYRDAANSSKLKSWPITCKDENDTENPEYKNSKYSFSPKVIPEWDFYVCKINVKNEIDLLKNTFLRLRFRALNGTEVYLQDIRFNPKNSLVQTFYYDQEYGSPIAMIDANNKVKYFEYDKLGRLVKMFNNSKVLIKEASYKMGRLNDLNPPMVSIPAGNFIMGDNSFTNASPMHSVNLSAFMMDKYEVTQGSYSLLIGSPSMFPGLTKPVECVTWYDAILYCNARSKALSYDTCYTYDNSSEAKSFIGQTCVKLTNVICDISKNGFRLPTEAEWEYACRAGTQSNYYWGESFNSTYAWMDGITHSVGGKEKNSWNLYDMAGNVWEWTNDWFGPYSTNEQTNPTGPSVGSQKVIRGGAAVEPVVADYAQSGYRFQNSHIKPSWFHGNTGFRCVRRP